MSKMKRKVIFGLSLIFWLGNSMATDSKAPSLNFKEANKGFSVSLFSTVKGQLLQQGKPLEGAKVERTYHFTWANKDYKDETYTDEQGRFYFSESVKWMLLGHVLPHEPVIPQKITVFQQGGAHPVDIWLKTKRNYRTMGELSGLDKYIALSSTEQMTPVMKAYTQGEIALKCDLSHIAQDQNDGLELQYVTSQNAVQSPCELQFPYQTAVDQAKTIIDQQQAQIIQALELYLAHSSMIFNALQEDRFKDFQYLSFDSIESINLYDHLELHNHLQDYASSRYSIALDGEIILNMINSQKDPVKIRMWLSRGIFRVGSGSQNVEFLSDDHSLSFNEFNIDAHNAP